VGVATEAVEEAIELGVQHGVARDHGLEGFELCRRRQFAMQKQVTHFQEGGLRRQLVDGITAVQQGSGIAVDEGQATLAGCGRGEARVESEGVGRAIQLADVDDVRPRRARQHRHFDRLALVGQGRRTGGFGHFAHQAPLHAGLGAGGGRRRPENLRTFT
jgi:hypothetical protein